MMQANIKNLEDLCMKSSMVSIDESSCQDQHFIQTININFQQEKQNDGSISKISDCRKEKLYISCLTNRSQVSQFSTQNFNKTHKKLGNLQENFLATRFTKQKKVRKAMITRKSGIKKPLNQQNSWVLNAKQLQQIRNLNKQYHSSYLQLTRSYLNQLEQKKKIQDDEKIWITKKIQLQQKKKNLLNKINECDEILSQINNELEEKVSFWFRQVKYQYA